MPDNVKGELMHPIRLDWIAEQCSRVLSWRRRTPENPFEDWHLDTNVINRRFKFRPSAAYGLRDWCGSKEVQNPFPFYMGTSSPISPQQWMSESSNLKDKYTVQLSVSVPSNGTPDMRHWPQKNPQSVAHICNYTNCKLTDNKQG